MLTIFRLSPSANIIQDLGHNYYIALSIKNLMSIKGIIPAVSNPSTTTTTTTR